ncbi:MAG: hypothetical protein AAFX65_13605 [Cyanobacteria bacterium J06638_7]
MDEPRIASDAAPGDRREQLGRFLLRGLRIGASTVAVLELLRQHWSGGISAALAWLVFLQVERRLPPPAQEPARPPEE